MTKKMPHYAIIVAAGKGMRAGGDTPKQFQDLNGQPILSRTLNAFLTQEAFAKIIVVIHPDYKAEYEKCLPEDTQRITCVAGGAARQESVLNGLKHIAEKYAQAIVHIHDAARCLVTDKLIAQNIRFMNQAKLGQGCIPALPLVDTIKKITPATDKIEATIDRDLLYAAQTPQSFYLSDLLAANQQITNFDTVTDDASIAEMAGLEMHILPGDARNLKITRPEDFAIAASFLQPET